MCCRLLRPLTASNCCYQGRWCAPKWYVSVVSTKKVVCGGCFLPLHHQPLLAFVADTQHCRWAVRTNTPCAVRYFACHVQVALLMSLLCTPWCQWCSDKCAAASEPVEWVRTQLTRNLLFCCLQNKWHGPRLLPNQRGLIGWCWWWFCPPLCLAFDSSQLHRIDHFLLFLRKIFGVLAKLGGMYEKVVVSQVLSKNLSIFCVFYTHSQKVGQFLSKNIVF